MRKWGNLYLTAILAAGFAFMSVQSVQADEKKPYPALEVQAGSGAQMHNSEGIKHYDQGHFDVAAKHFSEAVKADDKSAEAHYNYALSLDQLGQHKEATEEFRKAQTLGASNPAIAESPILKAHLERMRKK